MDMENKDFGLETFESALFGEGYQTDAEGDDEAMEETEIQEPEVEDTPEKEAEQEAADDDTGGENSKGENTKEEAESQTEGTAGGDEKGKTDEQMFTLKVNKQEKQVTLKEMTALAQKGADYDRVKQQYADSQQTIQALQEKAEAVDRNQEILDVLNLVADGSKITAEQVVESLYISFRKKAGVSEDAARLELKNARLDKELSAVKSQSEKADSRQKTEEASQRLQRDMAEFKREYPDVELTDELVEQISADIKSGLSLTAAYRKLEREQQAQRMAELERQLAAEKQNKRNKRYSPGSQRDSGGRSGRSDYDVFEKALFR